MRALIGETLEDGHIMVTGIGECKSRGVRKGEIVNFDNALACVTNVLEMAEEQARVVINQVHLILSGGHIQCLVNRGNVPVMSADGEITSDDVEQVMEMARAVSLPPDRAVLHTICQHFYVDDQEGVLNPEGISGSKLALDMLILHGIRNRVRNSVRVLKSAHAEVQDVAFGGLTAGLAVLTAEQKESGVIVMDLGGGTTDYLVYAGKSIACAGSLAVGGDHITNDIAIGLRIPMAQAEQLKLEAGHAMVDPVLDGQSVSLPPEGGFPGTAVRVSDLQTIISARVDEILNMVKAEVAKYEILPMIGAGVILTGGGAHLRGAQELSAEVFEMPCSIGRPRNVSGLAVVTEGPEYAAPLGMVRYGFKTGTRDQRSGVLGRFMRNVFGRG